MSDDESDIEEHTRELQIEIIVNQLNKALKLQKDKKFREAHSVYDSMANMDILILQNESNNTIINRLKYLLCRNRGMLRIWEIITLFEDKNNITDDDCTISIYGEIIGSINDLLNATLFGEPDNKMIKLLATLFEHFKHFRLARLCYEMKISDDNDKKNNLNVNDDLKIDLNDSSTLLLNQYNILVKYIQLLDNIKDKHSIVYNKVKKCLSNNQIWETKLKSNKTTKVNWNTILSYDQWIEERDNTSEIELNLDYDESNQSILLSSLLESIVNCVPKPRGKNKIYDSYLLTDAMIDKINIQLQSTIVETIEDSENINIYSNNTLPDSIDINPDISMDKQNDQDPPILPAKDEPPPPCGVIDIKSIQTRNTRSLRGKMEPEPVTDSQNDAVIIDDHEVFVTKTLPFYLLKCGIEDKIDSFTETIESSTIIKDDDIKYNISLFDSSLKNWYPEYSQSLIVTDKKKKSKGKDDETVREILNIKSSKIISTELFETVTYLDLYDELKSLPPDIHFTQLRIKVLEYLLKLREGGNSIIMANKISEKSLSNYKTIVDSLSISYYKKLEKTILYDENIKNVEEQLNIAISIYETLVSSYLEFVKELKVKKNSSKATSVDLLNTENLFVTRIKKWQKLINTTFTIYLKNESPNNLKMWVRFKWFDLFFLQTNNQSIDTSKLTDILQQLSTVVQVEKYYIPYTNFEEIPVLSYDSIQTQLSKIRILEIFDSNEKANEILESVLLQKPVTQKENEHLRLQLESFISQSNLEMKLRLWSLLLRFYKIKEDIMGYKYAFESVVKMIIHELNYESMKELTVEESKYRLLNLIGFFTYFSKTFIQFCDATRFECFKNDYETTPDVKKEAKMLMVSISRILYVVIAYFSYKKNNSSTVRHNILTQNNATTDVFNQCYVSCFFLLAAYYPMALNITLPSTITDFYSVCHLQLGINKLCSSIDNGIFLKFIHYKLTPIDIIFSCNDIFQVLHCRFGFSISLDRFDTFDHKCKPKKMTFEDAIQTSRFVFKFCFDNKKHPVSSPPRNDMKLIIDSVIEAVGELENDAVVIGNKKKLDSYLTDQNISLSFVTNVFNGKMELEFTTPSQPSVEIGKNGLYYLEGLVGLHFFRIRKRTMQSRATELVKVIKVLENDILCGCNRFETWVALGQVYSFTVEDDLIWTADKLNSLERKQATSMTEKKALLCYLNAISIYMRLKPHEQESVKEVLPTLWNSFGKELYNSWMEPMNKNAFHIFIDSDKNEDFKPAFLKLKSNKIPSNAVFKILELSFKLATDLNPNWFDYLYLSKAMMKLKYNKDSKDYHGIIKYLVISCDLALKQSNKDDPFIEPHYYLFSAVMKYLKLNKITQGEAFNYLCQNSLFENILDEEFLKTATIRDVTFKILHKIISYDKKNWQHRPVYRLAESYYYFDHDIKNAKEEMLSIINLKPSTRQLSTIWKPAIERPGKHFIYNAVYTNFLVKLLYESGDLYSLIILVKKMRRAGSIMVNLTKTFDNMMLRICVLIKNSISVEPGFLDDMISIIKFSDFITYSSKFDDEFNDNEKYDDEKLLHLYFLNETQGFRKLATGFGATGAIDECFLSIYMKMFIPYLFDSIMADKGNNISISHLLHLSKIFYETKSKQSTPDIPNKVEDDQNTQLNTVVEQPKTESQQIKVNIHDVNSAKTDVSKLTFDEKCLIINYLSLHDANNGTPTKEKVKIARRDIVPHASKIVLNTAKIVEKLKDDTNQCETLNYNLSGTYDDDEIERSSIGVMTKETKENKEDKEFEKLISAHDRSLNTEELAKFNEILDKFQIPRLYPYETDLEKAKKKADEEAILLEEKRQNELKELRDIVKSQISSHHNATGDNSNTVPKIYTPDVETNIEVSINNSENSNIPSEGQNAPIVNELFNRKNVETGASESDRGVTPLGGETGSYDAAVDKHSKLDVLHPNESSNPFLSPSKLTSLDLISEDFKTRSNSEILSDTPKYVQNSEIKDDSERVEFLKREGENENSDRKSEITSDTNKETAAKTKFEKTFGSATKQSHITNFFKISPTKNGSPIKTPSRDDSKVEENTGSVENDNLYLKRKNDIFTNELRDTKRAKLIIDTPFVDNNESGGKFKRETSHDIEQHVSRNFRKSSNLPLLELNESGHLSPQKDLKKQKDERLMESAEVIDSSSEEVSIIEID